MRIVVCTGHAQRRVMDDALIASIAKPFVCLTMDKSWWNFLREHGVPRMLFTDKLALMHQALKADRLVCIEAKDGKERTASMAASMHACNAVMFTIPRRSE